MERQMIKTLPFEADPEHRRATLGGEPVVFHCHHYNTFLQRSIRDAAFVPSVGFLIGAAAEVSFAQLSEVFSDGKVTGESVRREMAEAIFQECGFGRVDLSGVTESGGEIEVSPSHYSWAFNTKWDGSDESVCFFTAGWIAGATAAIYGMDLGAFSVEETECEAHGGEHCRFNVTKGAANYEVFESVGGGTVHDHVVRGTEGAPVDYDGVYDAVTGMDLSGNDEGMIPAFGVVLTRHYANYYNRISFELLRKGEEVFGDDAHDALAPLLVEAGHVCAFNTFGGIMMSTEWDALIKPALETPEDWVHGIVAVVNALGWGRWSVEDVSEAGARFVVQDDYESVGYRAMYGESEEPVAYLGLGAAIGIMNLVYFGDIQDRPELNSEFYDRLFKSEGSFTGRQVTSGAGNGFQSVFEVSAP
jgi:V4R domain